MHSGIKIANSAPKWLTFVSFGIKITKSAPKWVKFMHSGIKTANSAPKRLTFVSFGSRIVNFDPDMVWALGQVHSAVLCTGQLEVLSFVAVEGYEDEDKDCKGPD